MYFDDEEENGDTETARKASVVSDYLKSLGHFVKLGREGGEGMEVLRLNAYILSHNFGHIYSFSRLLWYFVG